MGLRFFTHLISADLQNRSRKTGFDLVRFGQGIAAQERRYSIADPKRVF
jgi:hypothetical protein